MWNYLNNKGETKGPVAETILRKFLIKRIPIFSPTAPVWTQGMEEWKPAKDVEPFASLINVMASQWYYLGQDSKETKGPFSVEKFAAYYEQGELVFSSLVFDGVIVKTWTALADLPVLLSLLEELQSENRSSEVLKPDSSAEVPLVPATSTTPAVTDTEAEEKVDSSEPETRTSKPKKKRKRKAFEKWNTRLTNRWVYITGLPTDVTETEVSDFFAKCGVLDVDFRSQKPKIKLYQDEEGNLKGETKRRKKSKKAE